jgi:hypothetical protein
MKTGAVVEGCWFSAAIDAWPAAREWVQVERPQPRSGEDERPGGTRELTAG